MKVVAVIQARSGSRRLPNKIFLDLKKDSLLAHVVNRLRPSEEIDQIVVATTNLRDDTTVAQWCINNSIDYHRGSEMDVLGRYYNAAKEFSAEIIVRITADDPFKDYRLIDKAVKIMKKENYNFVCNNNPVSFPEGLDVEVLTMDALSKCFFNATSNSEREHVTQYIHRNPSHFKIFNIKNQKDMSSYRWTIDTIEDYLFAKEIYERLSGEKKLFTTEEIYKLLEKNPELIRINSQVKRSDLYNKTL